MKYLKGVVTLALDRDRCIGCGMCTIVCPHGVFVLHEHKAEMADRDSCMECGACARNCPPTAIVVEAGVGCATGVLYGALGVERDCCCSGEQCSG